MSETQAVHDLLTYAAFPIAAWLFVALRSIRRVGELHHGYYGLALVILSRFLPQPYGVVVAMVGIIFAAEDASVHWEQARTWRPSMPKLTGADDDGPIHRAYAAVLGWFR